MFEHKVIDVRATGVMPGSVASAIAGHLDEASRDGWELFQIQPVIYNSSTTGYFLLILRRPARSP